MMRVDLHCHSTCSDGTDAPAAVGARARERAVALFCLTDHDTCAGHADAASAHGGAPRAAAGGAIVIRGAEISCDDDERTVHVLAYDTGGAWAELETRLDAMRDARRSRLRVMAERLARRGMRVDVEPILAAAGTRSVGRPDLARALVEQGHVSSVKEAFSRWLYDGGPGDAPGHRLPIAEALALGRAVGARMALAHPHHLGDRAGRLARRFRKEGLDGIEAYYAAYDPTERGRWLKLAGDLDLVCTAGSDRHAAGDFDLGVELPDDRAERLLAWLAV